ncbi:MAG: sulfotransferase [bacterium]
MNFSHFLRRLRRKLGQQQFVRKIGSTLGSVPDPDRWIFVTGCYNSGTTLLSRIIEFHPSVAGLPDEGALLTDLLPYPEQYGWPRMWYKCRGKLHLDKSLEPKQRAKTIKRQWSLWLSSNCDNYVEKSVSNVLRLPFLQHHFSPSFFIHIIRNGYAVAEGIQRKARLQHWNNPEYQSQYPIELCARQWIESNRVFKNHHDNLQRTLLIYYEDLTEHPLQTVEQVFDFLNLPTPDDFDVSRQWSIHNKNRSIENLNPESFRRLSASQIETITEVANAELEKHGYERKSP